MDFSLEITEDDVLHVLDRMETNLSEESVEGILDGLNYEAITRVALKASTNLSEQIDAAYDEIENQILEMTLD